MVPNTNAGARRCDSWKKKKFFDFLILPICSESYMKSISDFLTEYYDEPRKSSDKEEDDNKSITHDFITSFNLWILVFKEFLSSTRQDITSL